MPKTTASTYGFGENWSQTAFLQALCFEVCEQRPRAANACKIKIISELDANPRTIYVDEADRLHIGRLEDLRDINEVTGSPVVLIGEEGLPARVAARRRIDDRIPSEFRIRFAPASNADISLYAVKAADLRMTPEAVKAVQTLTRGNFRRIHNTVLSLEQMARADETDTVTEDMVSRLGGK